MCEVAGRVFAKLSVAGILDTGHHRVLVAGGEGGAVYRPTSYFGHKQRRLLYIARYVNRRR